MKRTTIAAVAAAVAVLPLSGVGAAPEGTAEVSKGQSKTFAGKQEVNANPFYFAQVPGQPNVDPIEQGTCSAEPHQQCDEFLVKLTNPLTLEQINKGIKSITRAVTVDVGAYAPVAQATDFDLQVFASDANGTNKGFWTGEQDTSQSGELAGSPETVTVDVVTTPSEPSQWMLVRVIRFLSPNSGYTATVSF